MNRLIKIKENLAKLSSKLSNKEVAQIKGGNNGEDKKNGLPGGRTYG